MVQVQCEACGKIFYRNPSQIRSHIFCSRACSREYRSKRMQEYNRTENPMNKSSGWSPGRREAVREREQRNKGPCKVDTYPKDHGRHEHRVVAEKMLGRPLKPGEVVHHKDGDKHNNAPENLMIFKSQKEHVKYHIEHPEESGVVLGKGMMK